MSGLSQRDEFLASEPLWALPTLLLILTALVLVWVWLVRPFLRAARAVHRDRLEAVRRGSRR